MFLYKELTEKIIKAAVEVHKTLGRGFLEKVYENALLFELIDIGLKAETQKPIDVYYKKNKVGSYYSDILVEEKIILELKVAKDISTEHYAQLLNYLKATDIKLGIILNFGRSTLQIKRIII